MIERTVYVDSDGVLVDFYEGWRRMFNHDIRDKPGSSKDRNRNWYGFVKSGGFSNLILMPNALKLIELVNSLPNVTVKILTSSGRPDTHEDVCFQKTANWASHGILWEPVIVPGKKHKKEYAGPGAFLIDDHAENIHDFVTAGGQAFFYQDSDPIGFGNLKKELYNFSEGK